MVTIEYTDTLFNEEGRRPICKNCGSTNLIKLGKNTWNCKLRSWAPLGIPVGFYCLGCQERNDEHSWNQIPVTAEEKICETNDDFRSNDIPEGQLKVHQNILSHGDTFVSEVLREVFAFDSFTAQDDTRGLHECGRFWVMGATLWFEIHYLNEAEEILVHPHSSLSRQVKRMLSVRYYDPKTCV